MLAGRAARRSGRAARRSGRAPRRSGRTTMVRSASRHAALAAQVETQGQFRRARDSPRCHDLMQMRRIYGPGTARRFMGVLQWARDVTSPSATARMPLRMPACFGGWRCPVAARRKEKEINGVYLAAAGLCRTARTLPVGLIYSGILSALPDCPTRAFLNFLRVGDLMQPQQKEPQPGARTSATTRS